MPPIDNLSRDDLRMAVRLIELKRQGHHITLPPPQQLFSSIEEAHELFMQQVEWSLRVARELDIYPPERQFVKTVLECWRTWLRYCPTPPR